jgi:hypothetical protein
VNTDEPQPTPPLPLLEEAQARVLGIQTKLHQCATRMRPLTWTGGEPVARQRARRVRRRGPEKRTIARAWHRAPVRPYYDNRRCRGYPRPRRSLDLSDGAVVPDSVEQARTSGIIVPLPPSATAMSPGSLHEDAAKHAASHFTQTGPTLPAEALEALASIPLT